VHSGVQPSLFHYREARGAEIDLLIEKGEDLIAVEIKSGATITRDFFRNLNGFSDRMKKAGKRHQIRSRLVYGGEESQRRSDAQVLSWRHVQQVL
jgi:predicted AAA+ superfamily ATPase